MSTLDELISAFERFPGVGSRQAKRFAFHILSSPATEAATLARLISELRSQVHECPDCHRFYTTAHDRCRVCRDTTRDQSKLLIVERDSDIDAIERSGVYTGYYFVLGGTVPLLSAPENDRLRGGALKAMVAERVTSGLAEIILGFAVNPDGENTNRYIETILRPLTEQYPLTISLLGRGLSTGSELEYADPDTIRHALLHRNQAPLAVPDPESPETTQKPL
jgi:recombination protein RecR